MEITEVILTELGPKGLHIEAIDRQLFEVSGDHGCIFTGELHQLRYQQRLDAGGISEPHTYLLSIS